MYEVTVAGACVDEAGGLVSLVVFYDGESFFTRVSPLEDITRAAAQKKIPTIYSYRGWLTCLARLPSGELICGDADGRVHVQGPDGWMVQEVSDQALLVVWATEDAVLAAGADGCVRRRTPDGWEVLGEPLRAPVRSIAGRSASDVMAVGDEGLVAHWDGSSWIPVDLPTSKALYGVASDPAGRWLVCGGKGTLFREAATWEDLSSELPDLHGLAIFQGDVWVGCGTAGPGKLGDDDTVGIQRNTFAANRIDAAGSFIAFAGNDLVVRFDGDRWAAWRYA